MHQISGTFEQVVLGVQKRRTAAKRHRTLHTTFIHTTKHCAGRLLDQMCVTCKWLNTATECLCLRTMRSHALLPRCS
jgi:hypothetical protein